MDRPTYDRTIGVLHRALDKARLDRSEKIRAFKRLARFAGEAQVVGGRW